VATARYGIDFSCAVRSGNIYGVQFHPEKSHHFGVRLLQSFAAL
jgi:glutamine amidotransferase